MKGVAMSTISAEDLAALSPEEREAHEKLTKAHELVVALCAPRGTRGAREWIMSIPARPDYDPDIVIGEAIRLGMDLLLKVARITETNRTLTKEKDSALQERDRYKERVGVLEEALRSLTFKCRKRGWLIAQDGECRELVQKAETALKGE